VKDTKAWVAKFLELREDLREQERRRLLEEEAQIARFAAEIERRQKATEGMREAQQAEKDRILEKLGKEKEENDRRRDEMEELINRLYFEEQEEKHRLAAKEKAARRVAMERDVKESNEQQRRIKEAIRVREVEQEQEFRQVMLEKFAEEDRVEQMNAQRRRMKMQEHKREVERLAAVKKAMHEEQMAREEEEADAIAAAEAADAAIVEGERKRLLMEHAARLKDFLPKGVLASGEDLDLINTVSSRLGEMSMTGTSRAGTRAAGSKAFAM
jgi:myosin heavy subunit